MKKRILSTLLGLSIILTLIPGTVSASDTLNDTESNITYNDSSEQTLPGNNDESSMLAAEPPLSASPLTLSQVSLSSADISFADAEQGYSLPSPKAITVSNIGSSETGALNIALSGENSSAFTLNKSTIESVAVNGNDTFTVVPKSGLTKGTYTETITVSGDNIESATATVSFTVKEPITYNEYVILSDDLDHVRGALNGIAEVTKDSETGIVTITLTTNVYGRLRFGENKNIKMNGNFVIDLGGNTIYAGDRNEALCLDNYFIGTVTITGNGSLKKGINHIIYYGNYNSTLNFALADGMQYFTLKKDNADVFDEKNTETKVKKEHIGGTEIVISQYERKEYTISFNANGGVVAPNFAVTTADGKLTFMPIPARNVHSFDGWYTTSVGGSRVTIDTIFDNDTTIYAHWTSKESIQRSISKFTIKFETNGGSDIKNMRVTTLSKLKKPADPVKEGYTFAGWYKDKGLKIAYNFDAIVTSGFVLYAKWSSGNEVEADDTTHICPSEAFYDLDTSSWYHEGIDYVIENEIFNGVTATQFAPSKALTRAMLVTVLYRMENEPATNRSIPFADIDIGSYYANAVIWAHQNQIVNGISETEFAPDKNVTREQLATIMFRYSVYKGMNAVTLEENLYFDDADKISIYAVSAMNWAVGAGLLNGKTENTLNPKDIATRAEVAAILHRYIEGNK